MVFVSFCYVIDTTLKSKQLSLCETSSGPASKVFFFPKLPRINVFSAGFSWFSYAI